MANTSANIRPPITAAALKAGAFFGLNFDSRVGEWVPVFSPASDDIIIV